MYETDPKIAELEGRLEHLVKRQIDFQSEITFIRSELGRMRGAHQSDATVQLKPPIERSSAPPPEETIQERPQSTSPHATSSEPTYSDPPNYARRDGESSTQSEGAFSRHASAYAESARSDLEKFIGENLLSKVGILILIIGVAIGAKYAIDKGWITPLMRIVFGYVIGFGLIGLAIRLKPKYHNFSAVLISGGMAIMYFITYFAYSLYGLLNQPSAFALMLIFTVFTVAAAINYARQGIAHVGLVGAYAIPFLLSDNSGNYAFLFTYVAIINCGILAISLKKYWKPLFYTSFIFSWLIYYGWFTSNYSATLHFSLALVFLTIFFLIFYATFLGYKLISSENLAIENLALILSNSFIFFGLGYAIIDRHGGYENYLGLFAVLNAALHLAVAYSVSRFQKIPSDVGYLLAVLVLTFVTIAVPMQFDGKAITLLWSAEGVFLFCLGRIKRLSLFEYYSYPLLLLASFSLMADWLTIYESRWPGNLADAFQPILNSVFLTGTFYVAAVATIHFINRDGRFEPATHINLRTLIKYLTACAGLAALYNVFRMEIGNYFHLERLLVMGSVGDHYSIIYGPIWDIESFNIIWQINYTLLFLSILAFVSIAKVRDKILSVANVGLILVAVTLFSTVGFYVLGGLRDSYLRGSGTPQFFGSSFHILIRYISLGFLAVAVYVVHRYSGTEMVRESTGEKYISISFDAFFYSLIWVVISSELINLMAIFGLPDSYKLGLSVLWGVYALTLVIIGIYQKKKYLRIGAMCLFGLTLAKVFLYDIADLDTISKTIVFVSLGILILIVAFLYNKYTSLIFGSGDNSTQTTKNYESL
jgi:hypothetical protein